MSRTLADVKPNEVYKSPCGAFVWRNRGDIVFIRQPDGEYWLGVGAPQSHLITGPSLGHVRDEPWRKADAGSLADAHNRIDALQARLDKMEQSGSQEPVDYNGVLVSGCIHIDEARKQSQCVPVEPPPAKPTQPPDVAVYEIHYPDGGWHQYAFTKGSKYFDSYGDHPRTALDAFDRLGWDELRRWGLSPSYEWSMDGFKWTLWRHTSDKWKKGTEIYADSEGELLTAARDIARKEGWR